MQYENNFLLLTCDEIWNELSDVIPIGGQKAPNSIGEDSIPWKKPLIETKNKTSDKIKKKNIPHRNPIVKGYSVFYVRFDATDVELQHIYCTAIIPYFFNHPKCFTL